MSETTKTPWKIGEEGSFSPDDHCESWIPILGPDGKEIGRIGATWYRHHSEYNNADEEHRDANAALIVAAVNERDEIIRQRDALAAALRDCEHAFQSMTGSDPPTMVSVVVELMISKAKKSAAAALSLCPPMENKP